MNRTEAGITHILILNGRGFANTREVFPVPAALVAAAETRAAFVNRVNGNEYSAVAPWETALYQDRERAGAWLLEFGTPAELSDAVYHAANLDMEF